MKRKVKVKIKTWIYRPDLAKIEPELLIYKGKTARSIEEEKRLVELCLALRQILIDY